MKTCRLSSTFAIGIMLLGVPALSGDLSPRKQSLASTVQTQASEIPNSQIDPILFLANAQAATELRSSRRLSEDDFIRMSRQKGVVVLDARSKNRYDQVHIKGAISLPFTDFSFDSLAQTLPDKSVAILIYCNNNFRGNKPEFAAKSFGAALNLSTFASLYEYGYHNVYELGPELDLDKTKLSLEGTSVEKYVPNKR
jgi:rhodanese-related sulfurtransferase